MDATPYVGSPSPPLPDLIRTLDQVEFVPPSAHDLDTKLGQILESALHAVSASWGTFYLCEGGRPQVLVRRSLCEEPFPCLAEPEMPCAVPQRVAATGTILAYGDLSEAADLAGCLAAPGSSMSGVSVLAVPVRAEGGAIIGVVELLGARDATGDPQPFPDYAPVVVEALAGQAATVATNAQLAERLREAQFETVFRLSVAAEFRDPETASHIQRMSRYSAIIARWLGLDDDEVEVARFASPMHDVGKLGIPDAILLKEGKLTEEEWGVMRSHTTMGARILGGSQSDIVRASEMVALTHHEKVDGNGYPLGRRGDDIPMLGRIVALADAFDAITSKRCYKEAESLETGLDIARRESGVHFDPDCVAALESGFADVRAIHGQFGGLE